MTSPDPETELIRRVDAFGAAAMGFDSPVEPEASRQKQRYESARAALLDYLADRTLTEREAAALVDQSEYRTLPMDQIGDWQVAMSKLRRLASTEEPKP